MSRATTARPRPSRPRGERARRAGTRRPRADRGARCSARADEGPARRARPGTRDADGSPWERSRRSTRRLEAPPDPGAVDPDALLSTSPAGSCSRRASGLARGRRSHRRAGLSAALAVVRADPCLARARLGALAAEHHGAAPVSTDLGREDRDVFAGRTR
jgi:hypothetical protein